MNNSERQRSDLDEMTTRGVRAPQGRIETLARSLAYAFWELRTIHLADAPGWIDRVSDRLVALVMAAVALMMPAPRRYEERSAVEAPSQAPGALFTLAGCPGYEPGRWAGAPGIDQCFAREHERLCKHCDGHDIDHAERPDEQALGTTAGVVAGAVTEPAPPDVSAELTAEIERLGREIRERARKLTAYDYTSVDGRAVASQLAALDLAERSLLAGDVPGATEAAGRCRVANKSSKILENLRRHCGPETRREGSRDAIPPPARAEPGACVCPPGVTCIDCAEARAGWPTAKGWARPASDAAASVSRFMGPPSKIADALLVELAQRLERLPNASEIRAVMAHLDATRSEIAARGGERGAA